MSPSASESRSGLVLELAEEFLDRYRNGQRPPLKEYTDRHPELASEIRDVFPAMALMENIAIADDSLHGDETGEARALHAPPLERLGDYRIIREVGRGGMGVVYEAEQVSLGRHVALKVLPSQALRDSSTRLRFEREAKAAARLHHTNIVPVFGVGEHTGTPYYVMQFIRGLGLDGVLDELRRLKAQAAPPPEPEPRSPDRRDATAAEVARSLLTGRFEALRDARPEPDAAQTTDGLDTVPPTLAGTEAPLTAPPAADPAAPSGSSLSLLGLDAPEVRSARPGRPTYWTSVARIGAQVADALRHAHSQGIVHRDIKPSNLLLDARGTVWVTDFGLAKAEDLEDLTNTGDILGTLRYMPPEAFGGKVDARGDVYSLGLTLYELLAFRPAFGERDRGRLIRQVTTEEPPRLRAINPEVPRDLETVVQKAVERDPAHRYSSAAELAADLQRFLDDEPIRARQLSTTERLIRWARRHRAVAALLAALAAVLTGGLAGMTALWLRAERSAVVARDNATRADFLAKAETRERQHAQEQTKVANEQTKVANERAEDLAWQDYINRVNRAVVELERDNIALAEDLLLGCPVERRGWEWHYVNRRCHSERLMLAAGSSSVNALAYSPDGRRIVSAASRGIVGGGPGNHDRRIEIWDRASGRRERLINGSDNLATSLAFSPDGARLAIGGLGPQVEVRDAATGNVLWSHTPRGRRSSMALAFSPDGTMLAVGHGEYSQDMANPVVFYRADTGEELFALDGPLGGNNDLAFHPDGKRLAVAGKDAVEIWDMTTRRRLKRLPGHAKWVYAVAYSPDGKILATGGWDGSVKLRDAETGDERLGLFGHEGFVMDLAFSPDGREIATVSEDRSVRLWEVPSGRALGAFHGHTDFVFAVAFSPDGREIATGGFDATLRVWDRKASLPVAFTGHRGWVSRFGFRADGHRLASVGSPGPSLAASEIRIWDPATGELEAAPDVGQVETLQPVYPGLKHVGSAKRGMMDRPATVSPDGKRIARVLSRPGTRPGYSDRSGPQEGPGGRAAGYLNNAVEILDAADGRVLHRLIGHTADVMDFAFSPDSSRLATASFDRTLKLWDVPTGREVFTLWGHTAGVVCLAFSPDGHRLASGGIDNIARVWDARPLPADLLAAQEARYRQRQRDLVPPPRTHSEIQWAETLESLGLADQAAAVRARIAASVPDDVKLLTGLAMRLREEGDLDGVRRLADAAQERFGSREDWETLWELAQLNLVAGREDRWAAALRKAARRPPDDLYARVTLAANLSMIGDHEALGKLADDTASKNSEPTDLPAIRLLSILDGLAGRLDRDVARWTRHFERDPESLQAAFGLSTALYRAGDTERLRRLADQVDRKFEGKSVPEQSMIAQIDASAGNWARAAKGYARYAGMVNRPSESSYLRGLLFLALMEAGEREEAARVRAELTRLLGRPDAPDDELRFPVMSLMLLPADDPEMLLRAASRAFKLDTKVDRVHSARIHGTVLYRAGRFEEAIALLQEHVTTPPLYGRAGGASESWAILAMAHDRLDRPDEAEPWLAKYRDACQKPSEWSSDVQRRMLLAEAEAVHREALARAKAPSPPTGSPRP